MVWLYGFDYNSQKMIIAVNIQRLTGEHDYETIKYW